MEAVAKLKNYPTSPRKMRLLADLIRGMKVEKALAVLEHNPKHPAVPMRKLVLSAISNWKQKNEGGDEGQLVVKTIFVDAGNADFVGNEKHLQTIIDALGKDYENGQHFLSLP